MMCLRARPLISSSSFSLFTSKKPNLLTFSTLPKPFSSPSPLKMSQTIEHIVLFNIKDGSDTNPMINALNSLISLNEVLHITAGPIHKNRSSSSSFNFTHMLHSRYKSKQDLGNYAVHPSHLKVVAELVKPICDDNMAVDFVSNLDGQIVIQSGSAMRITFLKLKEGLGESEKDEILKAFEGIKGKFGSIEQFSFGENFSPRSKGFSIGSIAVFPGLSELEALDLNEEAEIEKEKVRDYLESVIVVDYVVPPPQSANL